MEFFVLPATVSISLDERTSDRALMFTHFHLHVRQYEEYDQNMHEKHFLLVSFHDQTALRSVISGSLVGLLVIFRDVSFALVYCTPLALQSSKTLMMAMLD
jgi:hypothetical protein